MTGISTASLYNVLTNGANNLQMAWATSNEQSSSGLVSNTYGGLGAVSERVISFQSEFIQNSAWSSNATATSNKTQATYSALTSLLNSVTKFQTTLSGAVSSTQNNPETASALLSSANTALGEAASSLNQTYAGSYLFSGTATSTQPVNITGYQSAATLSATSLDASYYQGNSTTQSVQVGNGNSITYGVPANSTAISQVMTAIGMVAQAANTAKTNGTTPDASVLKSAFTLLSTGVQGLSNLQSEVSDTASRLQNASETATTYSTYLQGVSQKLTNVNVAQAAAQTSAYQTMLTASYKALADGLSVSLSTYLH